MGRILFRSKGLNPSQVGSGSVWTERDGPEPRVERLHSANGSTIIGSVSSDWLLGTGPPPFQPPGMGPPCHGAGAAPVASLN